jgi:predicted amidophosphoribosyltransferase
MNTSSTQEDELFICPLCNVKNRAAAKYCRRCGISRAVLIAHHKEGAAGQSSRQVKPSCELIAQPSPEPPSAPQSAGTAASTDKAASSRAFDSSLQYSTNSAVLPEKSCGSNPVCPTCDSPVRTSDRFCCWCGESQPSRQVSRTLKHCPECAQSLPDLANYCFACGRNVGANERLRMRVQAELFREESSEFFPTFDA